MSTRANVVIKSPTQGLSFYYMIGTSAYPYEVLKDLANYDGTPESLHDLCLEPLHVGNFNFYYEINTDLGEVKIWDSTVYWQNAPYNWREKGYNCWKGTNGKYGYNNWRKNRRHYPNLYNKMYKGPIQLIPNDRYSRQQLKEAYSEELQDIYPYMKKLRYNPDKVHTWLSGCPEYYDPLYKESLEEQALNINSNYRVSKNIATWRLRIGV